MKFISILFDSQIQKSYKLYQMNAREISERLIKQYNLPGITLDLFNMENELTRDFVDIKKFQKMGRTVSDYHIKKFRTLVMQAKEIQPMNSISKKRVALGYELMPIALSANGDIEDSGTKIELLDGFKRMFTMDEVPNIDILVKVYEELSDKEWINAMFMFNSWKFVDNEGARKYMDRGFQLGLYHRYGIKLFTMPLNDSNIINLINLYTNGGDLSTYLYTRHSAEKKLYTTLWNNEKFHEDIQSIYDIYDFLPVFTQTKKNQVEEYDTKNEKYQKCGLYRMLEVFVSLLGKVRRHEYAHEILHKKTFDMEIVQQYFADPALQKHFVKVVTMQVDGHVVNYIQKYLRQDMETKFFEAMGYPQETTNTEGAVR